MSLEHLLRDEEEAWSFFLQEAQQEGEFGMNFYQEVAQAPHETTRRVFFACRSSHCKHHWVREYFEYAGKWYRLTPTYLFSLEEDARCPQCQSRLVKYDEVHGKLANKPCGEECLNATGHTCSCSCGGANHGKGRVEVI